MHLPEIFVRFDVDDTSSIIRANELSDIGVIVLVGERMRGWRDIEKMYDEMSDKATGAWAWFLNDDALIQGSGWDVQLAKLPTTGLIVHPETYGLNVSRYQNVHGGNFPIVPNKCWKQFGEENVPFPADTALDNLLRIKNGWQSHFLTGITVLHERDDDEKLAAHRK